MNGIGSDIREEVALAERVEDEPVEVEPVLEEESLELVADEVLDEPLDKSVDDEPVEEPLELLAEGDVLPAVPEEVVPAPV